jgi:hypothetical protein
LRVLRRSAPTFCPPSKGIPTEVHGTELGEFAKLRYVISRRSSPVQLQVFGHRAKSKKCGSPDNLPIELRLVRTLFRIEVRTLFSQMRTSDSLSRDHVDSNIPVFRNSWFLMNAVQCQVMRSSPTVAFTDWNWYLSITYFCKTVPALSDFRQTNGLEDVNHG